MLSFVRHLSTLGYAVLDEYDEYDEYDGGREKEKEK